MVPVKTNQNWLPSIFNDSFSFSITLMAGAVAFALAIHSLSKKSLKILGNQFEFVFTGTIFTSFFKLLINKIFKKTIQISLID